MRPHICLHTGRGKIHTGGRNAVHVAVHAVLVVGERLAADLVADERQIVTAALHGDLETVKHRSKEEMLQTAVRLIDHQDADIISPVCLEGSCHRIRQIAKLLCGLLYALARCRVHIIPIIQCLADGCR